MHSAVRDWSGLQSSAAGTCTTTAAALPVFMVGALAVELRRDLGIGPGELGLAVSIYYLVAACGSVPASRMVEQIGGLRTMRAAVLSMAAILLAAALGLRSWASLVVVMVIAGAVAATIAPATNLFLIRRLSPAHQGLGFGIKQASVPFASLLAGVAVPAVALTVGWRWVLAAGAAFAVLGFSVMPRPQQGGLVAKRRAQSAASPIVGLHGLVVLAVGLGLGVAAASGTAIFLLTGAVRLGFSEGSAGLVVAAAGGAAVVGRIGSGIYVDRRKASRFGPVVVMLGVGIAGYGLMAGSFLAGNRWLFAAGGAVALGFGWGWNGLFNLAISRAHVRSPAKATGVTQAGGRLGGVVGPAVLGLFVSHHLYATGWLVAGLAAGAACVAIFWGSVLVARIEAAQQAR